MPPAREQEDHHSVSPSHIAMHIYIRAAPPEGKSQPWSSHGRHLDVVSAFFYMGFYRWMSLPVLLLLQRGHIVRSGSQEAGHPGRQSQWTSRSSPCRLRPSNERRPMKATSAAARRTKKSWRPTITTCSARREKNARGNEKERATQGARRLYIETAPRWLAGFRNRQTKYLVQCHQNLLRRTHGAAVEWGLRNEYCQINNAYFTNMLSVGAERQQGLLGKKFIDTFIKSRSRQPFQNGRLKKK